MDEYDGRQFVGIDRHRQRSVIVRQSETDVLTLNHTVAQFFSTA
jgi:hypothetical protein